MPIEPSDANADAASSDPLADLLFTLIAAVLPAILLLAPLTGEAGKTARRNADAARPRVTFRGHPVVPIVAAADGIRIDGRLVGLERIGDDPDLAARLEGMRRGGEAPLLLVEPEGIESAFLFDLVAAAHGPALLEETRSPVACRAATDAALKALCGAPA